MPELKITRRRLPHWEIDGAVYFITFRVAHGSLSASEMSIVLDHAKIKDGEFYDLYAAVILPDHVHIILKPYSGYGLKGIMKGLKGTSARQINKARNSNGSLWQDEWFDRIMRDEDELLEKQQYMLNNSVKNGLAEDGLEYPWFYISQEKR